MIGYIVQAQGNKYLTREGWWYDRERPEDAYVFSEDEMAKVCYDISDWNTKPEYLIPAVRVAGLTFVVGKPREF